MFFVLFFYWKIDPLLTINDSKKNKSAISCLQHRIHTTLNVKFAKTAIVQPLYVSTYLQMTGDAGKWWTAKRKTKYNEV